MGIRWQLEEAFAEHLPSFPSAESTGGGRVHIMGIPGIHGQKLELIPEGYEVLNGPIYQ